MVKADVSRDYYADLEVAPTASEEDIKKAFRSLAKIYHPDRNPGKELDVVPKFQAVQAAHEILSDPEQRRKYDQDRGKIKASTPSIPRRGPVPPTPSPFPPPPRRTATTASRQNPFAGGASTTRTWKAPPPAKSETYAAFARAGAQQWDKTKDEAQSKADAFRGFQQMRPGQSPTGERFAPPPPPRPSRYVPPTRPTSYVPKSAGAASSASPRPQKSWDELNRPGRSTTRADPSPGFPGLSRAQTPLRKQGFTPATPGGDEPQAPRSSAYGTYSSRPQASTSKSYFPEDSDMAPPQKTGHQAGTSPLRHARSSGGIEGERHSQRPGFERGPSRYSSVGGERTDIGAATMGRSSSVRNSPIDSRFYEHERDDLHHLYPRTGPARHRSSSPKLRSTQADVNSSSSDSETSTDEDVEQTWAAKPGSTPRQSRPGQFPGTNYVKPPTTQQTESGRYQYRPNPLLRNPATSHAAFNYVPGYSRPPVPGPVPGVGNGHAAAGEPPNGANMYAPFHSSPREWLQNLRSFPSTLGKSVPSLNGFPAWAVPSSLLPRTDTAMKDPPGTIREERRDWIEGRRSEAGRSAFIERPRKRGRFADSAMSDSSSSDTDTTKPPAAHPFRRASQEDISRTFSAADWSNKFASGDVFRPTPNETAPRRSPVRPQRSRAKSQSKAPTPLFRDPSHETFTGTNGITGDGSAASETFVPGEFSEEGVGKPKFKVTIDVEEEEDGTDKAGEEFKAPAPTPRPSSPNPGSLAGGNGAVETPANAAGGPGSNHDDNIDAMDLDDAFPSSLPSTPSDINPATTPSLPTPAQREAGSHTVSAAFPPAPQPTAATATPSVNLASLSHVSPFQPSSTGIADLTDLHTTLPFESRPSPARPSQLLSTNTSSNNHNTGIAFASLKALNLPKPPKLAIPPLEGVTQESWERYTAEMAVYMREWAVFDRRMVEHFVGRQALVGGCLMGNWMTAAGDGPSGEEVGEGDGDGDGGGGTGGRGGGEGVDNNGKVRVKAKAKAGYAAYRQWMEEDGRVREWWMVACERHMQAVRDLGRVRERAKVLAGV